MRHDVCYYFPADVKAVYEAYVSAATNRVFRRNPNKEPYHTIGFGMNFSVKYNINGGSCIIRFIPYNSGTAVNLRFTLAQAGGARCNAYADELSRTAGSFLGGMMPQLCSVNVNDFLNPLNQVTAASEPQAASKSAPTCRSCSATLREGDAFCFRCGTKAASAQADVSSFCTECGKELMPDAAFCSACGAKV